MKILDFSWFGPGSDGVKFLGVHFDTVSTNNETEVFDFGFVKLAFGCVGTELGITESIEDQGHMVVMFRLVV